MNENKQLWQPSQQEIESTSLFQFIQNINTEFKLSIHDYDELHAWSIEHPERFWSSVWSFCHVKSSKKYENVRILGKQIQDTQWFPESRLNFSENLLKFCFEGNTSKPAIISHQECSEPKEISYQELYEQVACVANTLTKIGVKQNDRVVGYLPNIPETVIAMLACTSLGAIWSSCSPDFGYNGVLDRFGQVTPKVIFTADGYQFKGKRFDSLATVKKLCEKITSIKSVIVVANLVKKPIIDQIPQAILYDDQFINHQKTHIEFKQLPFNHPLYIMYSSGTTGVPKCIVHGAGGTLIQHLKELVLHTNVNQHTTLFYYTTCGWMMWNWLVSGLATGATLVLYDGSPFYPNANVLLTLIDTAKINVFGTSAKYISALEKEPIKPAKLHSFDSLRTILSTGSCLSPESYDYVYREVKKDVQLSSISGGTDIISCFALGNPISPVHRGELQCRGLGMDVDIFDDEGKSIQKTKGELVCKNSFPSMPLYFWEDKNHEKYTAAYFKRFPNIWAHGDYAELTRHSGIIIHGRSDTILNPGGVRIGTAEIYRQVESLPQVLESIAIGQSWSDDVRVILFVKLRENFQLDETLKKTICSRIRDNTTPRHIPALIFQVDDIPRTISGKIVELAVRNIIHHEPVKNIEALANPEALNNFANIPELEARS